MSKHSPSSSRVRSSGGHRVSSASTVKKSRKRAGSPGHSSSSTASHSHLSSSQYYNGYSIDEIERKMKEFKRALDETDIRLEKLEKSLKVIRHDPRPKTVNDEISTLLRKISPHLFD